MILPVSSVLLMTDNKIMILVLNSVIFWAKQNNMTLNEDKFELIQHHSSVRDSSSFKKTSHLVYTCLTSSKDQEINYPGVSVSSKAGLKKWFSPFTKVWWDPYLNIAVSSGVHWKLVISPYWKESKELQHPESIVFPIWTTGKDSKH